MEKDKRKKKSATAKVIAAPLFALFFWLAEGAAFAEFFILGYSLSLYTCNEFFIADEIFIFGGALRAIIYLSLLFFNAFFVFFVMFFNKD